MGGPSRPAASVSVGASAVTRNAADLDGFGEGLGSRSSPFDEPTVVVAGGNRVVADLDGAEDSDIAEATDDALASDGGAASPGPLVAGGAHRATKGGGLLAARRAGLQGLGRHPKNVSRET